jgi:hypothetical protein
VNYFFCSQEEKRRQEIASRVPSTIEVLDNKTHVMTGFFCLQAIWWTLDRGFSQPDFKEDREMIEFLRLAEVEYWAQNRVESTPTVGRPTF